MQILNKCAYSRNNFFDQETQSSKGQSEEFENTSDFGCPSQFTEKINFFSSIEDRMYEDHQSQDLIIDEDQSQNFILDQVEGSKQTPKADQTNQVQKNMSKKYKKNIGVIRTNWRNKQGRIISICYGTAFAITDQLILSCAHSCYNQITNQICSDVFFIPNHCSGKLLKNKKYYRSADKNFIKLQIPKTTFSKKPLSQDIALILLKQKIDDVDFFPQVGLADKQDLGTNKIQLSGYPSLNYQTILNINKAQFERIDLYGQLKVIDNFIIHHDMKTNVGHSGSAILGFNKNKEDVIIGVHTHRGRDEINSGVFLNNQIIERLYSYEKYFISKHNIDRGIRFSKEFVSVYRSEIQKYKHKSYNENNKSNQQNTQGIHSSKISLVKIGLPTTKKQINITRKFVGEQY